MAEYNSFIPENVAPKSIKRIGVYDSTGKRVLSIPLGHLSFPTAKEKLYSFGALSDIHIGQDTSTGDFSKALTFFSSEVDFICISGDLAHDGNNSTQKTNYKSLVETYATVPVYACAGNHDGYNSNVEAEISSITGYPLYFTIEHGDDLFIFVGNKGNAVNNLFTKAELQWLYETLEENRNRRCFLFEHVRPDDSVGNALGIYQYDCWGGNEQTVFESLLRHYKNVIMFHGHSHLKFDLQQYDAKANVAKIFGCWSVHVPSITVPRGTDSVVNPARKELFAESEGYVVDVYENGIHLRGRDFITDKYLPIASYWLDTTPQIIEPNTYTDSTNTITTNN